MKLAVVTLMRAYWGGSEALWAATAREAISQGIEVGAFLFQFPTIPEPVKRLGEIGARLFFRERSNPSFKHRVLAKLLGRNMWLDQQLRQFKPDLLVVSQGGSFEIADSNELRLFLEDFPIPLVIICQHNNEFPIPEKMGQRILDFYLRASLVCFVSDRNLKTAERQLGTRLTRSLVVQNPINLPDFQAIEWPESTVLKLACVARLETYFKGQDLLLEALADPATFDFPWELTFFGEGPDRVYLNSLVSYYGLSGRVHFPGHLADVRSIWKNNQLLVLPSRSEGTPLALIEALIAGRPGVVTDVGGNACWVREGVTGFIAPGCTVASIRSALKRAWMARDVWKQMGEAAHRQVLEAVDRNPGKTLLQTILREIKSLSE